MTSRSQQAWQTLRAAILTGALSPGEQLRFEQLQQMCGMSVSPVREALARLVAAGLVEGEHNRGYRVTLMTLAELDDLVQMRIQLEGWALERSITQGDENWEAEAIASLHRLERLPRKQGDEAIHNEEWAGRHAHFHSALISAAGSPVLLNFCDQLYDRSDRYRRLSLTVETGQRDVSAEHRSILDAALARDVERARALLAHHYEATAAFLRRYLQERK
ncbi:MAG TPA: FCD domain-containing protein [Pseudolabrys sp.]|nr:FCD domain-containing protein [Pseudolabrys sp.]